MKTNCARCARLARLAYVTTSAAVLGLVTVGANAVYAADSTVIRVEEDWELDIKQPDPDTQGPQVTCAISPTGDASGVFAAFNLNHRQVPEYHEGGLQLQLWNGEESLSSATAGNDLLAQNNEQIHWTSQMTVDAGVLSFAIVNGSSQTWGSFGGGDLRGSLPTELTDLNGYSPAVSVANSGVGFAGNRVVSLTLRAVRVYSKDGLILEDNQPKQVYPRD